MTDGSGEKKPWWSQVPFPVGLWDPFPNTKLDDPPSTPPHPVKEGLAWDARAKKKSAQPAS